MREQFGTLNAGLAETVTGIEVVKATAQEEQEQRKFEQQRRAATAICSCAKGEIQARYLPPLLLAVGAGRGASCTACCCQPGALTVGELVAYMGLMGMLRFPPFISIFTFSLVQMGVAGARRILRSCSRETELDENEGGHRGQIRGEIVFDHVTFGYGDDADPAGRLVPRRAGPDGRDRRADRLGQEHADQAGQPHLRRDSGRVC